MSRQRKPFRDGAVHVHSKMCRTCIFRPGNKMVLRPGVRDAMVEKAILVGGVIPCHETLHGKQSVCRGFYNLGQSDGLHLAAQIGMVKLVEPPK